MDAQQAYCNKLRRMCDQMKEKHTIFDSQEMSVMEETLTTAEENLSELQESYEKKLDIFTTRIIKLEKAVDERLAIVEDDAENRLLLEEDPRLMQVFAGKHAELLRHIMEAKTLIAA
tara:strand:- start:500 stop:850 length:351 start_codon:yes stop_codon:yes gene_type:complete